MFVFGAYCRVDCLLNLGNEIPVPDVVGVPRPEFCDVEGVATGQAIPGEDLAEGEELEAAGQAGPVGVSDHVNLTQKAVELGDRDGSEQVSKASIILHSKPVPAERTWGVAAFGIADQAQDLPLLGFGAGRRASVGHLPKMSDCRGAADLSHVAMHQQRTRQTSPGGLQNRPMARLEDADGIQRNREPFRFKSRPFVGARKSSGQMRVGGELFGGQKTEDRSEPQGLYRMNPVPDGLGPDGDYRGAESRPGGSSQFEQWDPFADRIPGGHLFRWDWNCRRHCPNVVSRVSSRQGRRKSIAFARQTRNPLNGSRQ